ncbi:type 2 isopentenyl-diphosphate Delta-isomerase [Methanonatronarchaeum sp. AMET6-2]|uniref:type 2 isopentenyl-diphosphate Delta-isomerase n=1 Tax=Methanonatronarchaeum sp. AMET6-2 TaxID=2933293 RepID=UPI001202F716|nr:type 2 isopentenyl-diphosphate Delta-isomerase [Methanonatronarchaeum sp. AMET6-2]RZN61892.1 MAG: type 2 isopentenyl-diphosphate Delta-isomerase [Methanonatronarchaeia archaeon]UOY10622.1 type 2 isopentenyl-diphosphate Delta-isomerase [Methanonatronarchaeum sp. AMET6-2]
MKITDRKLEHLYVSRKYDVESSQTGFKDVSLVHKALPEVDKEKIETKTSFLGKQLDFPFVIPAITGGHPNLRDINRRLALAAEKLNVGIGVGSQRAAIENQSLAGSLEVVGEEAPNALKIANLGAPQLVDGFGVEEAEKAIEMIDADVLCIHLNFLQEAIQLEGDTNSEGVLEAIKLLSEEIEKPLMVKETGAGISREVGQELKDAGVDAIDIAGLGGTDWTVIEMIRARNDGNKRKEKLGQTFSGWGIPTAASLLEVDVNIPIMASGGIRSGIDIAKSIALDADVAGAALPLVEPAANNIEQLKNHIKQLKEELKVAMFLTGSKNIEELKETQVVVTGKTREWKEQRSL